MARSRMFTVTALFCAGLLAGCTSSSGGSGPSASTAPATSASAGTTATHPSAPSASPSVPAPIASFQKVSGKATTLHFTPDLVRALYTRGVSTVATGTARLVAVPNSSNAVLPITAGSASFYGSPALTKLNLEHATSGLTLSSDTGSVRVTDFALQLGTQPSVTGRAVITSKGKVQPAQTLRLFDLVRAPSFKTVVHGNAAEVSGLQMYISSTVGQIIDTSLGAKAFDGKRVLAGTITISLSKG